VPHIDWTALLVVALVSVVASVVFAGLLAGGIRALVAARAATASGAPTTGSLTLGYGLLALAALTVLYGLYLIVPQFH
jgi:hypothetical protein